MNLSNFPDLNVWLALVSPSHVHSDAARRWWESCDDVRFYFCRFTQIGLLRLMTTPAIMQDQVLGMDQAWGIFDGLLADRRIQFLDEPVNLEHHFRLHSSSRSISPKLWSDAYLTGFANAAGLRIVTFDKALGAKGVQVLVLG